MIITKHDKFSRSELEDILRKYDSKRYKLYYNNQNFLIYPMQYIESLDCIMCFSLKPVMAYGLYLIKDIFDKADENGYEVMIELLDEKEKDKLSFLVEKFKDKGTKS